MPIVERCNFMVLLHGKHIANFAELGDARAYAYFRVESGYANVGDVVNRLTGEVMYHCEVHTERKVVEGFDYDE